MDIYKKYLKYKNKYHLLQRRYLLSIKESQIQFGGNNECPDNYKLCGNDTNNLNLCIKNKDDCDSLDTKGITHITDTINPEATRKGYTVDNLHYNCYLKEGYDNIKNIEYVFKKHTPMKKKFKIATYNIWGIDRSNEKKKLIKQRMPLIVKQIEENDLDIVCFQEMSYTTYSILSKKLKNYKLYETRKKIENFKETRKHDIECAIAIKKQYIPKKIIIEPLGGNLTYTNSLMIIIFDNLTIYNCYLQAGTKYSPGQEKLYLHYSRCRLQLLEYIINKIDKTTPSIILGDFNIDLNNSITNFPELRTINKLKTKLKFIDNWTAKNKTEGYTENTDTNIMRWNDKFMVKKTRVDGIFSRGFIIKDCILIGDKDYIGVKDKEEKEYIINFTPNKDTNKLKRLLINNKKRLPIFASDHYCVASTLEIS